MSNGEVVVLENEMVLPERVWEGQRVVTYEDIAKVHRMKPERVRHAFYRHKNELYQGIDYFDLTGDEVNTAGVFDSVENEQSKFDGVKKEQSKRGGTRKAKLFTESGYLILACTFGGEKAAQVRRMLVNSYFRVKDDMVQQIVNEPVQQPLTDNNVSMVDILRGMVEVFADQQDRIDQQAKEIESVKQETKALSEKMQGQKPAEGAVTLERIAEEAGWFSKVSGKPHTSFAAEVCKACGIRVQYNHPFDSEYSQSILQPSTETGLLTTRFYVKPAGQELIADWSEAHNGGHDCCHYERYQRTWKEHKPGDIKENSQYYIVDRPSVKSPKKFYLQSF